MTVARHPLWLDALGQLLTRVGDTVEGHTTSPAAGLALVEETEPDLLIIEVEASDGDLDGWQCLRRTRERHPNVKVIAVADAADDRSVDAAFASGESADEHDLRMDWDYDGVEFDEESKLREETRKILELPKLPVSASTMRVPVLVGHAEAVWVETVEPLTPEHATELLAASPAIRLDERPSPGRAAGGDHVLVGRVRRDPTVEHGLALLVVGDNLRKGAALNAIQIAELLLERAALAA